MSDKSHPSLVPKLDPDNCLNRIREILTEVRNQALRTVNAAMVAAYWEIGRETVEEEQRGADRADYGRHLLREILAKLTADFGKGFGERNLRHIRQFYLAYRHRSPEIRNAVRSELPNGEIRNAVRSESRAEPLPPGLSWSHWRVLMRVATEEARSFYEVECAKSGWSVRELQRQIGSLLFERLARSRDKEGVLALAREGHEVHQPIDLIKDPYVLEFVGLPESARWLESDLEEALISRLQSFLQELEMAAAERERLNESPQQA